MVVLRILRLLIGLLCIGVALWALNSQRGIDGQYGEALAYLEGKLSSGIPTLPADRLDSSYEGELVHVVGVLDFDPLSDPLTGLSLDAFSLTRHVEMLQWQEERYRENGKQEHRKIQVWSEEIISEASFHEIEVFENHENPDELPWETQLHFSNESLRLGQWPLADSGFFYHLGEPRPVVPDPGSAPELADEWRWLNQFVFPREQVDGVGSARLYYEYFPASRETYSLIGRVTGGKLEAKVYGDLWGVPLAIRGEAGSAEVAALAMEHLAVGYTPQKHWIPYTFVGLMLVIGVMARWIQHPACRAYVAAPFNQRLLISAVMACVGTAVLGLIAWYA